MIPRPGRHSFELQLTRSQVVSTLLHRGMVVTCLDGSMAVQILRPDVRVSTLPSIDNPRFCRQRPMPPSLAASMNFAWTYLLSSHRPFGFVGRVLLLSLDI